MPNGKLVVITGGLLALMEKSMASTGVAPRELTRELKD